MMRTLEQAIEEGEELARGKRKAAEYFRYKFGQSKDYKELLEAAEETEQFVKWLKEARAFEKCKNKRIWKEEQGEPEEC
jgi:hypothetical protein